MVIGGVAGLLHGTARHTEDVDLTALADGVDLGALLERCHAQGLEERIPDALAFATQSQVLLLVHRLTGVPVDVTLAWLPYEEQALARAQRIQVQQVSLPVIAVQDLILYKFVAWRPRDQEDVRALLIRHRAVLDHEGLRTQLAHMAALLECGERLVEFDAMWAALC